MTGDEVLAEVGNLAALEHAVIVECLSVHCALGHDLEAAQGGSASPAVRQAAGIASGYAQHVVMDRFKNLNLALLDAGRDAQLDRAPSVAAESGPPIGLDPPTAEQLERLLERERGIASAVDKRYTRLATEIESATGLDPAVAGALRPLIQEGSDHVAMVDRMKAALGDPLPIDILRATRRVADGSFEQNLLDLSDGAYGVVIAILRGQFVPDVFPDQTLAVKAMSNLDAANRVLVQRGLLPPFSPA